MPNYALAEWALLMANRSFTVHLRTFWGMLWNQVLPSLSPPFFLALLLSSVALYARQPIIIAYIALGVALGPFGLAVVSNTELVSDAGHVGIICLLFLLGF